MIKLICGDTVFAEQKYLKGILFLFNRAVKIFHKNQLCLNTLAVFGVEIILKFSCGFCILFLFYKRIENGFSSGYFSYGKPEDFVIIKIVAGILCQIYYVIKIVRGCH